MGETMKGLVRSHRCSEVSTQNIGENVTVMGWVQKRRNLGSLIFIDLRDRSGLLQILFDEDKVGKEGFEKAGSLRSEYVIAVTGQIAKRGGAINPSLKTGEIEVIASSLRILSESEVPPFQIEDGISVKDELRLKHRYLDLRRPRLQNNLILRSKIVSAIRNYMDREGFLEMETPILIKSTPEGARDYLVPSRVHPGSFYALPQSPQLFKQLLMCSGFDRYYQVAKCFRDEDLRADRQPEFTQIDMELSFVDEEDVMRVNEGLLAYIFKEVLGKDVPTPFPRITWQGAMDLYGSDKPDTRFGMEICDISKVVANMEFPVFQKALEEGGCVRGICVPKAADMGRKKIDKLVELAKESKAGGLAYIQIKEGGEVKSSFSKFVSEEEIARIIQGMGGKEGDLLLICSDVWEVVVNALGNLRLFLGKELDLIDKSLLNFLWVTDFPQFEWDEEDKRFVAKHHPFTMPKEEDLELLDTNPAQVHAKAYDIVLNGSEIGGGSVRIHQSDIQEKMFTLLGFSKEAAKEQFGFLLDDFAY